MDESVLIASILDELKSIDSARPFSVAESGDQLELPQWISAGDGQMIVINRKINDLICKLADEFYVQQPRMAKAISRKDWASLVQRVIGPLLSQTDLDQSFEASAEAILVKLQHELATVDWSYRKRTFLFGCSLIENHDVSPFRIGPVTVWKREKWVDIALINGQISRVSHRRLLARWAGKPIKKRKPSRDADSEYAVADAVGGAPYVCTVETEGIFGEIAQEKAVMAARFFLLGVALMWASPSKALTDLNLIFDGLPFRQTYGFFQEGPRILNGSRWRNSLHGLSLFGDRWEPLIQQRVEWWKTLQEVIEFWLSPDGKVSRPVLMNQFVQSLIWFHEACREPMPMIATTKFMAALDALACGGKAKGIKALITARFGVEEGDPIRTDGPSFSKVIDDLYSQGRSRLIHGSSDRIGHDWNQERGLAESLTRLALIACLHWAADHERLDDPKAMAKR